MSSAKEFCNWFNGHCGECVGKLLMSFLMIGIIFTSGSVGEDRATAEDNAKWLPTRFEITRTTTQEIVTADPFITNCIKEEDTGKYPLCQEIAVKVYKDKIADKCYFQDRTCDIIKTQRRTTYIGHYVDSIKRSTECSNMVKDCAYDDISCKNTPSPFTPYDTYYNINNVCATRDSQSTSGGYIMFWIGVAMLIAFGIGMMIILSIYLFHLSNDYKQSREAAIAPQPVQQQSQVINQTPKEDSKLIPQRAIIDYNTMDVKQPASIALTMPLLSGADVDPPKYTPTRHQQVTKSSDDDHPPPEYGQSPSKHVTFGTEIIIN
jgi:hypothetical protein